MLPRFTACLVIVLNVAFSARQEATKRVEFASEIHAFANEYCAECHRGDDADAGVNLGTEEARSIVRATELWERVIRKLRTRQMPPLDAQRPSESEYQAALTALEKQLDVIARSRPRPGRTDALRRLNRTQYANAIRDLLEVQVDVDALLPPDASSHGFDNVTVSDLSPTLMNRYIAAAQRISRIAVGTSGNGPLGDTIRLKPDVTQEEHVPGLPIGTRGGAVFDYTFPQDGEYDVQVRLARDRNEEVEGLRGVHSLEILLDRQRAELFTIKPPRDRNHGQVDAHLKKRIAVTSGPHRVGVTFLKKPSSLVGTKRQPYDAHFNMHRHPRLSPAVFQISITGPYQAAGATDSPSRARLFVCEPTSAQDEPACARKILRTFMRRAYRRAVTDVDFEQPMKIYTRSREGGAGFDAGMQAAVSAVLTSPHFLFHIEREPAGAGPHAAYRISDVELGSRLSFFLWSSLPDDALLDKAIRGELSDPGVLAAETRRMLADPRAATLATNFASQWLYLRNLESITPDSRLFPDFDDNLRQAFREETELLFDSIRRDDRSVLELLDSNDTFLNERLAKHYKIPHIYGSRMRRVSLDSDSHRGGILRHGSVLTVTSYATRTSPVIRGNWILENLVGSPPPPPPANVPALRENTVDSTLSVRERLAAHRANPACAGCHRLMDPVGFALENFDAVGRWRDFEQGRPVDVSGGLHGAAAFAGVAGLEQALLQRPEVFTTTFTEKLLTFATGRGCDHFDGPAIRKIVSDARGKDDRFSAFILGIVNSVPFQMREAAE